MAATNVVVLLVPLLALAHAGRLPYLGGDIQELIDMSKQANLEDPGEAWITTQRDDKPVTVKQKRDSSNYNTKFTDIARAYAEGYKAAIKAVQARAIVAKRRLQGIRPYGPVNSFRKDRSFARSFLPGLPYAGFNELPSDSEMRVTKSTIPAAPVPELIPGIQQSKEVASPSPVDERETHTLPTLNDFSDNKAAKEEMVARSNIPLPGGSQDAPPPVEEKKSTMPVDTPVENTPKQISTAGASQVTENAVEKSSIPPTPAMSDAPLDMSQRSTRTEIPKLPKFIQEDHPAFPKIPVHLRSDEDRSKIARMNARARHRNIYFDSAGGDPFNGGGVLSVQNAVSLVKSRRRRRRTSEADFENLPSYYLFDLPKFRRRRNSDGEIEYVTINGHHGIPMMHRRRRSSGDATYMPKHYMRYRRSHMPYLGQNLDALGIIRATPKSWTSAQVRKSLEMRKPMFSAPPSPYTYVPHAPGVRASPFAQTMGPSYRGNIPQPQMTMMAPPMAVSYGQMYQSQPTFYRSMIPGYPALYNQMPALGFPYTSPLSGRLISEETPSAESSTGKTEEVREKKSTVPAPGDQDNQTFETVTLGA